MSFSIALVQFESFNMLYRKKGHGLCLCGLGIDRYHSMGCALFAVLQTLMPQEDTYIRLQLESVAMIHVMDLNYSGFSKRNVSQCLTCQKNLRGQIGTTTSFNMPNRFLCTVIFCIIGILPTQMPTAAFSSSRAVNCLESRISQWCSHINRSTVHQFNFHNTS